MFYKQNVVKIYFTGFKSYHHIKRVPHKNDILNNFTFENIVMLDND